MKNKFYAVGIDKSEIDEAQENTNSRSSDVTGEIIGQKGYLSNYSIKYNNVILIFMRNYWHSKILIDKFTEQGIDIDKEIELKKEYAKDNNYLYIPVRLGEKLTIEKLTDLIKGYK